MITDLNETIKQLLTKRGAFDPAEVDISFEAPDREWSGSISKPTVNVYLYDIRENLQLRGTEWTVTKDDKGIITRKKTPSRIDLSYLITVWTNDIGDEHRLLWHVLATLFRYPDIPAELLSGRLAEQEYVIRTTTIQPDGLLKNPADFWSALDNQIKPSINYIVTMPLDIDLVFTAPEVKTKVLGVKPPDAEPENMLQILGKVLEAGKPDKVIPNARVVAKEVGMSAETDEEGQYTFPRMPAGKHTFQVFVPGKKVKEMLITVPSKKYDLEV